MHNNILYISYEYCQSIIRLLYDNYYIYFFYDNYYDIS